MRKAAADRTIIALVLAHIALLIIFVFFRYIDGDEGFYLTAAQQVAQGRALYHDFFFPQMPFLPYVQSFVSGNGFSSLYLSRLIGLIPAILSLLLFVRIVITLTTDRRAAALAIGAYAFSGLIMAWHSPAKTYAWTDLLLLMTFWSLLKFEAGKRQLWMIVSLMALALAVNFRLVTAAAIVPYGYCLWKVRPSIRIATLFAAVAGAIVVSAPTIQLLILSPDQCYFGNLGFHLMRDPTLTFWVAMFQRFKTVMKLILNPQILMVLALVAMTLRAFGSSRISGRGFREYIRTPYGMAGLFGATMVLVYLIPAPIHQQYFVQALPLLLLASLPAFERVVRADSLIFGWRTKSAIQAASAVYLAVFGIYLVYYLHPFVEKLRPYSMSHIRSMVSYLREYPSDGPVFCEWSGAAVLSGHDPMASLEFVGFDYLLPISDDLKRHYHFPVNDDLNRLLRERVPTLYVVWNAPDKPLQAVADSNYVEAKRFENWVVYERRDTSGVTSR